MAFAAIHYSTDKDQSQLSCWPDNAELSIAGETFFDQYLTFDHGDAQTTGGEVLQDPPSPSLLLESLQNELRGSSCGPLDLPPGGSHAETPVTPSSRSIAIARRTSSADRVDPHPATLAGLVGNPILSNGSISDSELLHLEGISLQSSPPRRNATAPSTPPFGTAPLSPSKHSRYIEKLYATVRRVPRRPKLANQAHYPPVNMATLDPFLVDSRSGVAPLDLNYGDFTDQTVVPKREPIECHGLPLTPPPTGRISDEHRAVSSMVVGGPLEDPFSDEGLGGPTIIQMAKHRDASTPIHTPVIDDDSLFGHHASAPASAPIGSFRRSHRAYRSTSSAEWPAPGLLTNVRYTHDASTWSPGPPSAAYVIDNGGGGGSIPSPGWWDNNPQTGEMSHAEPAHHSTTTNMRNQPADLQYEYNSAGSLSGLMIHMPQPRASVLSFNNEHVVVAPTTPSSTRHHHIPVTQHGQFQQQHGGGGGGGGNNNRGHGYTDRRPRPRAPSSGARHLGSQTSPRKLRHSRSMGALREESPSPSPMTHHHGHHAHHGHQGHQGDPPASPSVRKARSFTRRSGRTPRTPSFTMGTSGGGRGGNFDFVNYTPENGQTLMKGVAPSGSSKTKARRDKEAREKEQRIRESTIKELQAAPPSVLQKLINGFEL
ncbi:hypothetical protein F5B17DRAFT_441259 [Nemania serpens]|nr:hypothetical protein F5B17DRAFT_441259 [Nemania serpens]